MRRLVTLAGLTAALLVPAAAARADKPPTPNGHGHGNGHAVKPEKSIRQNASQICRAERGTTDATRAAFRTKYGTNHNGANAFGKCVSSQTKALRGMSGEQKQAKVNAAKACSTERGTTADTRAAFADKYGTGPHNRNAFGRCVSATVHAAGDQG